MKLKLLAFLFFTAAISSSCQPKPELRLNEFRVIGSHNSYKIAIESAILKRVDLLGEDQARSLEYGHISLTDQLDLGLRNLEIDVFHDPVGGRFAEPLGREILRRAGFESPAFDVDGILHKPGLKVFHIQDIDFRSHNLLFLDVLEELKRWSDQNPNHLPVFITLEAKDKKITALTDPLPITQSVLDSIDGEILHGLGEDKLITPDLVRGNAASVNKRITGEGWPELSEVSGRFIFVLDDKKTKMNLYLADHPGLQGRVMFVNAPIGSPESAFLIINNPVRDQKLIKDAVNQGYIVRTRADAGTKEARSNDYSRFHAAISSNAQVITTDYYLPSKLFPSTYRVIFEDGSYVMIPK